MPEIQKLHQKGNLTAYVILIILIIIVFIFYLLSLSFQKGYLLKPIQYNYSSPSPFSYPSPTTITNPINTSPCLIGGCSGQLCTDTKESPLVTTCEYKEEYSCLKYAVCEKQANGTCGFTQTTQYLSCINDLQNQQIGL